VIGIVGRVYQQLQIGCDGELLRQLEAVEDLERVLVAQTRSSTLLWTFMNDAS
jgi:hypothetical protein